MKQRRHRLLVSGILSSLVLSLALPVLGSEVNTLQGNPVASDDVATEQTSSVEGTETTASSEHEATEDSETDTSMSTTEEKTPESETSTSSPLLPDEESEGEEEINTSVTTLRMQPEAKLMLEQTELNQYGTVSQANFPIWEDAKFTSSSTTTSSILQQTFFVQERVAHDEKGQFYSLYTQQKKFVGYVAIDAVTLAKTPGGSYFKRGIYGTVVKKNYAFWQNFEFGKQKSLSTPYFEQTLSIRGEYHHFNGSVYYSVYNKEQRWLGYINRNALKEAAGEQGIALKGNQQVVLPSNNYSVWKNFKWQQKNNTNKMTKQVYRVKIYYRHFNGATYYSLYDKQDRWQGYINSKGTKKYAVKNGITYVDNILLVNKKHQLPASYNPGENKNARQSFNRVVNDLRNAGYDIGYGYSGYRSFKTQRTLYQNYVNTNGRAKADTFSARAGHSEHQAGLAFDLTHKSGALVEKRAEKKWLETNAHKYGFIVRYQAGKESITGYQAEPWHLRYIGTEATKIKNSNLTLEEYLGLPGGGY